MTQKFDAYYKWFGIRPQDQPPDHYRLLGIQPFESDHDVISNAADQRMSHLRSLQNGPHAAESQRILNEVSKARVTLLDAERKLAYDVAFRKKIAAAATAEKVGAAARRPAARLSEFEPLDELSDESDLDLDAPRFEDAAPLVADARGTAAIARPVHGRQRSSPILKLMSVACGGALGLVLVYSLLGNLAGVDPLGVFPPRDAGGEADGAPGESTGVNNDSRVASKPAPNGNEANAAIANTDEGDTPTDSPGVGPSKKPPGDASGKTAAKPAPRGTKQPSPNDPVVESADPFAEFPPHVALPAVSDASPHALIRFAGSPSRLQELLLLTEAAAVDDGKKLELLAANSPDARRWSVRLADADALASESAPVVLAEIALDGNSLTFHWLPSAAGVPAASQLQNCLVKFRTAESEAWLRLRAPAVRPAHVLDFSTAASLVEIPVDAPPRPESLMLEIGPGEALPWGAEFKDERSRIRFVTATKEKIIVMLGAISDVDRPELPIEPQASRKGLHLRIAPRIVNAKGEFSLSLAYIAEVRKKYSVLKIKTDKQWNDLNEQKLALEKRAKDLDRQLRSGSPQRELVRVNAQLSQTNAAFKKVNADKMEFDGVLDLLPAAEALIGELQKKGKIPYRVYATVGTTEVDLVRALE